MIAQAISTSYVSITAKAGRSSAVGLYVTSFYIGGAFGAALGGAAWTFGGWPACVGLLVAMQVIMASLVFFLWSRRMPPAPPPATLEPA
jgi:predicted MFS family arabinose efflux permease